MGEGTRTSELKFNKTSHVYRDGKKHMPSVTAIAGKAEDKGGLIDWAAKSVATCAIEEAAELSRIRRLEDDDTAFEWLWQAANRLRDGASVKGSDLHDVADRMTSGQEMPEYLDPNIKFMAENVLAFLAEYGVETIHSEARLANRALGYAGTTDQIAIVPQYGDLPIIVDWKGLAIDTPIPTPSGWSNMGRLAVGDEVFDRNGQPTRVTGKSSVHHKPCYRVTFSDGTSVICDDDHRWVVETGYARGRREEIIEARFLAANLRNPVTGQRHLRVPLGKPLDLADASLPIDPYVLGCWLGDGTASSGAITKPDDELFKHIEARGYTVLPRHRVARGVGSRTVVNLSGQLRAAGLLNNKHIPQSYLRASSEQRLALLRGLMDTDGTANIARRGECSFTSVDKATAYDVMELALSLGHPARVNEINGHGFGRDVTSYDVSFRAHGTDNPFALGRKAERVGFGAVAGAHRMIVSVEPTITVPTQCIEVDSPTSTYLCTEKMIPTHNTSASMYRNPMFSHGKNSMQLSAYGHCECIWWDDKTEADMPEFNPEVGLVVTIRPEGYRVFDYDLTRAWPQFERALESYHWWRNVAELAHGPVRPAGLIDNIRAAAQAAGSMDELLALRDRAVHHDVWSAELKSIFSARREVIELGVSA